jgi:hypothetical protein
LPERMSTAECFTSTCLSFNHILIFQNVMTRQREKEKKRLIMSTSCFITKYNRAALAEEEEKASLI